MLNRLVFHLTDQYQVGFHERSYHNLNFIRISSENTAFSEGWSWFKFNNLGHIVGGNLKFYTGVAKGLKLKIRNLEGASSYVCRSYREKTGRGDLFPLHPECG